MRPENNPGNDDTIRPSSFVPPVGAATRAPLAIRHAIRKRTLAVAGLLVTFSLIAWFLLSARAVHIATTPEHSHVDIDGGLHLKFAERYLLRPGDYALHITAAGYHPLQQPLAVSEAASQDYAFQLRRLPGHLRLGTGDVTGAQIFIDGVLKGVSPMLIRDLPHGKHQLTLRAERYLPVEQQVLIEGLDKEQALDLPLSPAWADISFSSVPAAAELRVDGQVIGQTPLVAQLIQGQREVRIALPGYKAWQETIQVSASKALRFDDIRLEPADALVALVSRPPAASVTLDGQYQGLTPLEIALQAGSEASLSLFKEGYRPASRTLRLASGERQALDIALQAELVAVTFNVSPEDAELYVDGTARGPANQTIELPAKRQRIEIRKAGYVSHTMSLSPNSGIAQQVNVALKTLRQAELAKVQTLITTSAGQELKLFYPTPFTMGASRREPGRRANETLRQIVLERPFYLSLHEVSNAQFRAFAKGHSSGRIQGISLDGDRQPAVNISWEQAALYCNWLSKQDSLPPFYKVEAGKIIGIHTDMRGYRLPSEAEWAWAARSTGTAEPLKFPWEVGGAGGARLPPPKGSGNYADQSAAGILAKTIANYQDNFPATAPIGSFPANSKGLFDMGGNVAEWMHDFYAIALNPGNKAERDPLGPERGKFHVIRGASWAHGSITELRLSYRDYNEKARNDVGFRIARYL